MKWFRGADKREIKGLVNQHAAEPEQGSGQNGVNEHLADIADGIAGILPGAAEHQVHQDAGNHAGKGHQRANNHECHGAVSHGGGESNLTAEEEEDKREAMAHEQGLENR